MARTFNGSIWGGIGNAISRDAELENERRENALGKLFDAAKFAEKAIANRKLKNDMEEYYRKKNERQALGDIADANDVEDFLEFESLPSAYSLLVDEKDIPEGMEGTIWGVPENTLDNVTRFGFDPVMAGEEATFIRNFDPDSADMEEKRRAQRIVGTKADGYWGPKSIKAYNKYMGA